MPKGLTDSQLDEFIKRLDSFEQTQGSFSGKGLTIEEYTGGKAKDIPSLKKLIQDSYLSEMKKEIGQDFNNIETPILFELLDYKFNTGRSVSDLASFSIGDSTLDKVNKSSNLKVSDWSKLNLDNLSKAKDQVYKTTKGYTLDNPNPTYKKSWKDRIGATQANPKEVKDFLTKAAVVATTKEENPTADIINNDMPKDNITGSKKTKDLALKNNNPGNLRVVGSDTEFQKFNTIQEGYDALTKQIELYKTGDSDNTTGNETLVELMRIYAPKKDKNNPEIYANKLAKELGISIDTPIKDIDSNKLAVGISSIESPEAYNSLIKTENINLGVDLDDKGNPILLNTPPVPKPKYVAGKDEKGSYIEILNNKGFEDEYYVKQYVNGAEQLGSRTIGDTEYIVKGYTDDNGVLQTEYLSHIEKGSQKNKLVKENKLKVYKREINDVISNGITNESAEKARSIADTAQEDFKSSTDLDKREKDQLSFQVGREYYRKVAAPYLQERTKKLKDYEQKKLFDLKNDYSNTNNREEKEKIGKLIAVEQDKFNKIVKRDAEINRKIKSFELTTKLAGSTYKTTVRTDDNLSKELTQFNEYQNLIDDGFKGVEDVAEEYNKSIIEKEEATANAINKVKNANGSGAAKEISTIDIKKSNELIGTNDKGENPDNTDNKSEDFDENGKDYYDKDYLEKQLSEVQEQLSNSKKAEEFTPDLSALESKDKYGNLIAQAGDLGAGIIGLQGAMEEVPVYNKGDRFNQYTEEAYNQRNMGLSSEESGLRKQLAERGFGYDVKNIRRLSGGSAGVALGNLGRASTGLQNRYAQIAAEDSAVRRMNQQRFDRSAMADESFNRRKFEDSFKTTMLNKEMGAQLVRDKMKNMNERSQFEKQYGEGSIYNEISKEVLTGKQYNNHALKMAQQYQKQKAEDYLTDREEQIKTKLEKANE